MAPEPQLRSSFSHARPTSPIPMKKTDPASIPTTKTDAGSIPTKTDDVLAQDSPSPPSPPSPRPSLENLSQSHPHPRPRPRRHADMSINMNEDGPLSSFDANRICRETPNMLGRRSGSQSPFRLTMPPPQSPGQLAFSAMQFLPVPLLVLNNLKTVVLANEAMGRMLGLVSDEPDSCGDVTSTLEQLRGQTLSQVGIDILQDGRLVWLPWEDLLDSLVVEMGVRQAVASCASNQGDATPTAAISSLGAENVGSVPGHDDGTSGMGASQPSSVVEVVISCKGGPKLKRRPENQVNAKMIITIFEIEDHQVYFTLTFTHTEKAPPTGSRKSGARSSTHETAEKRTISISSPPSVSSSHGSGSPYLRISPSTISLSASPFPPMGPPSRMPRMSTPSLLQKMTKIKDALLDCTEMPIFAMWNDGSAPVMNRAAHALLADSTNVSEEETGFDLLPKWQLYTEDFSRRLTEEEYPISVLLSTGVPYTGMRFGMYSRTTGKRVVFDVVGETIKDDVTGECVAGVVTCRDITSMAQEITDIREHDEERFKLICDTMPQMVWTTTPEGQHDYFNGQWYDYTGLPPEDSLGTGWKNPFHPDDMPATERRWKHSLATGEPYVTEYRCLRKDGEWRWMLGRALPLKNKQTGKIEKWFGTCTDVHESLQAKLSAKKMRQQLLSVLSHAQTTVFCVNRDRKVTMLEGALIWNAPDNSADNDSEDMDSRRYIGKDVYDVFNDLSPQLRQGETPAFLAPVHDMLSGKTRVDMVHEHNIDRHFFRTRLIPTFARESQANQTDMSIVDGVIGVIMDVTELKQREIDLKTQVKEKRQLVANEAAAKEASRLKSQFLANMSHEIRTPITGVIGMAELLCDLPLGEEQTEYAENIIRSANALLTVINDILDFSKVESGRLDIEEVQFSLSQVVRDVSKMLSFAAERKSLDFRSDISLDIAQELVVLGDPGRVRQIITNLLTNSIKFTNSGYVKFSVLKEKETRDTIEIKFVVQDTGIGIEEKIRKKLFQPFSQGDASTARKFGGTGLGLTISKNLLDLMHGRITLESSVGSGTTATFWIPFNKSQSHQGSHLVEIGLFPDRLHSDMSVSCNSSDYEQITPERSNSPLETTRSPRRSRTLNNTNNNNKPKTPEEDLPMSERAKISVLVVEDNAINQKIATKTIEKLGFKVNAAWNGKEALEYLEASKEGKFTKPDIILMDVQMPVIDGYKTTHILRHHVPYRVYTSDVPIVAMTASAIRGDKEKCTKAGMDDYLAKPVKGKILERMLVRWSKSRRVAPQGSDTTDPSMSDCSETGEQCLSSDIPTFGLSSHNLSVEAGTTPGGSSLGDDGEGDGEGEGKEDDCYNLLTPKPLTRNASQENTTFPFGSFVSAPASQPKTQFDINELAMQLRDDKLLDAGGDRTDAVKHHHHARPVSLSEGDSLTEENVERLEQEAITSGRG